MRGKQYAMAKAVVRFRRWSRKGYAAFVSCQRVVTIGMLAASLAERFQKKNLSLHSRPSADNSRSAFLIADTPYPDDFFREGEIDVQPLLCPYVPELLMGSEDKKCNWSILYMSFDLWRNVSSSDGAFRFLFYSVHDNRTYKGTSYRR